MTFLVSVLWALLTFANTGFGHMPAPHAFHYPRSAARPMDTNGGGPTAPAPAPSPTSST